MDYQEILNDYRSNNLQLRANQNHWRVQKFWDSKLAIINKETLADPETLNARLEQAFSFISTMEIDTPSGMFDLLLNVHFDSLKLATMMASHPYCPTRLFGSFLHFLPVAASENPAFTDLKDKLIQLYNADWEEVFQRCKPHSAIPISYGFYDSEISTTAGTVSDSCPHIYKCHYWLEHGSNAEKRYILGLDKINDALIETHIESKVSTIRKALAERTRLPKHCFAKLAKDKARTVRTALAANPITPPEILAELSCDPDTSVREASLANKQCPEEAVHSAMIAESEKDTLHDADPEGLKHKELIALLADATTNSEMLDRIARLDMAYIRAGCALHANTAAETLRQLATDQELMVRQSVAFNPNTSLDTLENLLQSSEKEVLSAIASNPACPESLQLSLVEKLDNDSRLILANTTELESVWRALSEVKPVTRTGKKRKHPLWQKSIRHILDPEAKGLYHLARRMDSRDLFINKMIARHPKCPKSLLPHYAYYIFDSLAQNPKVSLLLLENPNAIKATPYAEWKLDSWFSDGGAPGHVTNFYLNADNLKRKRQAINIPTVLLHLVQKLVFESDTLIKKRIAAYPLATPFMLEVLARDEKPSVREMVAKHRSISSSLLQMLAEDKAAAVRAAVVQNKNFVKGTVSTTKGKSAPQLKNSGPKKDRIRMASEAKSIKILKDLVEDRAWEVRKSVAENKRGSIELLRKLAEDEHEEVRYCTIQHSKTDRAILEHLLSDKVERVRIHAFWRLNQWLANYVDNDWGYNYNYDETFLARFYHDPIDEIRHRVAKCTANAAIQKEYAATGGEMLYALAGNYHLDHQLALEMIEVEDRRCRQELLKNTPYVDVVFNLILRDADLSESLSRNRKLACNPEVHLRLSQLDNAKCRLEAARLTEDNELLKVLANDASESVRATVAMNSELPADIVDILLTNVTPSILRSLFYETHPTGQGLQRLVEHESDIIREIVAESATLSLKQQRLLVNDVSPRVREALAYRDDLDDSVIALLKQNECE